MKTMLRSIALLCLIITSTAVLAQYTPPDEGALEQIYVERYYIANADDACDTDGGSLPEGAVTYRVFVDMKPGYGIETIYGNNHPMEISTTTEFFNNEDRGEEIGTDIGADDLGDNTVSLDSYLTIGGASDGHWGMPKWLDDDGSIVGGTNNDGGSCGASAGLVAGEDALACEPVTMHDGMIVGSVPEVTVVAMDLSMFGDENSSESLMTTNGAYAVLGGTVGPTEENMLLIGQFTTDGDLSFILNIRLSIPDSLQCTDPGCHTFIDYFSEYQPGDLVGGVETENRFEHPGLTFNSASDELSCVTSLEEDELMSTMFSLYPNPTEQELLLNLSAEIQGDISYEVLDMRGQLVMSKTIGQISANHIEEINLEAASAGLYLVKVIAGKSFAAKRVLKR